MGLFNRLMYFPIPIRSPGKGLRKNGIVLSSVFFFFFFIGCFPLCYVWLLEIL